MIAVTLAGYFAVLTLVTGSSELERPTLTKCPGESDSTVDIQDIIIENTKIPRLLIFDADIEVNAPLDSNPTLYLSFFWPNGTQLGCPDSESNCTLRLCNGTRIDERLLNSEWGNTCPIVPGIYIGHLSMIFDDDDRTQEIIGDGNLVIKLVIENGGTTADCVTFPVSVEPN